MERSFSASFQAVEDWLRSLGLLHYAQSFYDNGYEDIETVKQIGEQDLNAIEIKSARDRNDILRGVNSLRQNLYFELELNANDSKVERVKLEPILLKTKIKECLQNHNVQLIEPPYFNPDGSLGDLYPLAIRFSDELETLFDDVLQALENLRKRQLPVRTYDAMTEDVDEGDKDSIVTVRPPEYLDCETPEKSRSYSFSKFDTRVTKSTTDLTKDFINKQKEDLVTNIKRSDKPKSIFGRNVFRKKQDANGKSIKGDHQRFSSFDYHATDVNLSQNEIIDMLKKVKNHQLSQEDALAVVKKSCKDKDRTSLSPQSSPEASKKVVKEGSVHKKTKIEKSMIKRTSSSQFYTQEDGKDQDTISLNDYKADRKDSLLDTDLLPSSLKSSPESQKHGGFFKGLRNSMRKKGKVDENKLDGSHSGATSSHESVKSEEHSFEGGSPSMYIDLSKSRSSSTKSTDAITSIQQSQATLPSSISVSELPSVKNEESSTNQKSSLKIKSYEKYQDQVSSRQNHNKSLDQPNNVKCTDRDVVGTKDIPKPPPRVFKGNKVILTEKKQVHVLPVKPHSLKEANGKPVIPPRKGLTSPTEQKNIDQIGQEVSQLIAGLNNDLQSLNNPEIEVISNNETIEIPSVGVKLPIMPPKPAVKHMKSKQTEVLINELKTLDMPKSVTDTPRFNTDTPNVEKNTPESEKLKIDTDTSKFDTDINLNKIPVAVPRSYRNKNKVNIKRLPLKQLVMKKLHKEQIDVHRTPYTKHDGLWNIPLALISRYATELCSSDAKIEECIEDIRVDQCKINGLKCIPMTEHKASIEMYTGSLSNIDDWLFHVGLPMFFEDLKEVEVTSVEEIDSLSVEDFINIGIFEEKHVVLLLKNSKQALNTS